MFRITNRLDRKAVSVSCTWCWWLLMLLESCKRPRWAGRWFWSLSKDGIQNLKDVFTKYNHASQCRSFMFCRSYPQNVMVQKVLSHRQLLQWSYAYVLSIACEYRGKCAAVLNYQWDSMVHWLYLLSTSFLDFFFYHRCLSLRIPGISKSKNQPWLTHLVQPSIMGMVPVAVRNITITIRSLSNASIL